MVRTSRPIVAILAIAWLAVPVYSQTARASGVVRDATGRPIQGATIRATLPDAGTRLTIATSDSKGRWAMLGLHVGTYTFVVDAPGFLPLEGAAIVRTSVTPPLTFMLSREPGPSVAVLPRNIQAQITAANRLRDLGRLDEAIDAYREIRARHASLTSINLVIGAAYRRQASLATDAAGRLAALERAVESYTDMLKTDPDNERARAELASTRAEATAVPN